MLSGYRPVNKERDSRRDEINHIGRFSGSLLHAFYIHHELPLAITSDWGPQSMSGFLKIVCEKLAIRRRLSTAFHLESDGSTERANQEVERILRAFTTYAQNDWKDLLPIVAAAIYPQHSLDSYDKKILIDVDTSK